MVPAPSAGSVHAAAVRATATTGAPASANARAIPRPKPRLAPTTTVVLPDKSLMFVLFFCVSMGSLALVLVVAADPELEPLALVAALRRAVQDRVVTHQELHTTRAGGIGVVDSPVVQGEDAEALGLGQVMDYVGAGLPRIAGGDRRQLFEHRHDPLARLLLAARETECEVELALGRRHPGETPAHPTLVRLQLLKRGLRNEGHRDVARLQMRDDAVNGVRDRRAGRAACLI